MIFGFKIINPGCNSSYDKPNYSMVLTGESYCVMNKLLSREFDLGAVNVVPDHSNCMHGIFSIPKSDGSVMCILLIVASHVICRSIIIQTKSKIFL